MKPDLQALLPPVTDIARQAGLILLDHYNSKTPPEIVNKSNNTPVTNADLAADAHIRAALRELTPDIAVVTEETVDDWAGKTPPKTFWIVDPLDGTRLFINRRDTFQTQIALIVEGVSVLGVVHQPVFNATWSAAGPGTAKKEKDGITTLIKVASADPAKLRVVSNFIYGDLEKLDAWLEKTRPALHEPEPSQCKFCAIAEGIYDVFPFFVPHSEWDTAPGQAILEAAGGALVTLDGKPLRYGNPGFVNGPQFALGGISLSQVL